MAQDRQTTNLLPTNLAAKILDFIMEEGVSLTNSGRWNHIIAENLLQGRVEGYIALLREMPKATPEGENRAEEIILEIMDYQRQHPFMEKPDPTILADKILDFIMKESGNLTNSRIWVDIVTENLLQGHTEGYIAFLREIAKEKPEAKGAAEGIILEILDYEGKLPGIDQMPISEVAKIDFVGNPDRDGTGGIYRGSIMLETMLQHTVMRNHKEILKQYDEAWMKSYLKDDFQPKVAVLQLGRGGQNRERGFLNQEQLKAALGEEPYCDNYELVYLRDCDRLETEEDRMKLNERLFSEFNADAPRPRDYYGHSLSVSDVIVIANDFGEQYAYYVEPDGFAKLPDDFLSHKMSAKIRNDLDIRQESMLYENIREFEEKEAISIIGAGGTAANRQAQITSDYQAIFEMADRRGAVMDMDALGYEPYEGDGFFLEWRQKGGGDENIFGFDGWDMVKDFVARVNLLQEKYTLQDLQKRIGGDYSIIEYGEFSDREVQTAINRFIAENTKEQQENIQYNESITFGGEEYKVIDRWQDNIATYAIGQLEDSEGTWYVARVTDQTEQYQGEYNYEYGMDKPARNDFENAHLDHISAIDIDRHEEEYGADGSRNFPNLNALSPEEEQEKLRQSIKEKTSPVEIDETLTPKDQLRQRLENGVRQVLDSNQFKNWLKTGGKLYYNNYSFRNAMLVWLQKPEASYVMGYEQWKEFGRNVQQGAKGAKIFIPIIASEKYKGGLYKNIKGNLNSQLAKDQSLANATYRLGSSSLEFTMNRANHLIGLKINGKEQRIFNSDEEARRFIDKAIIGKVPIGYNVGTVFDAKDVTVSQYLWVKHGYTKAEIAPDENGNPIKNKKGEVRIFNTPERQALFQESLDTRIAAKDPVKMQSLYDACVAASMRKGVPVSLVDQKDDSTLNGGASGYYSRKTNSIVIDSSLEITNRCAVLLHEMGHADLHKNLEALAKSMGEQRITNEMREVQAEAVAYATASTFGIETDTSSFAYLATYSLGFDLQDFQKSLDVIYRETQALTKDIKTELDLMGLNLDLTEKPKEMLEIETLQSLSAKYMDYESEQSGQVQMAMNELPNLIRQNAGNPELIEALKYQKENLENRRADLDVMLTAVENLNTATTRGQQMDAINILDAAMERINKNAVAFESLKEGYALAVDREKNSLKADFEQDPKKTLDAMKKDYPQLAKLSEAQLQFIAESKFVLNEYGELLREHPDEFAGKVTERAESLSRAASKNGTFVEVNNCEQWTDAPFFEKGTLCSPKIADKIVTGCEAQARKFSEEAEKNGGYFPYTKCDLTVFTPDKEGKLLSVNTNVNIGDGCQLSLKDHLEQICKGQDRKEVLTKFTDALSERADKRKLIVPGDKEPRDKEMQQKEESINLTGKEWGKLINQEKDKASQAQKGENTKNNLDSQRKHDDPGKGE